MLVSIKISDLIWNQNVVDMSLETCWCFWHFLFSRWAMEMRYSGRMSRDDIFVCVLEILSA